MYVCMYIYIYIYIHIYIYTYFGPSIQIGTTLLRIYYMSARSLRGLGFIRFDEGLVFLPFYGIAYSATCQRAQNSGSCTWKD